jgi:hypothetical protein
MRTSIPAVALALVLSAAPADVQEKQVPEMLLMERASGLQCPMPVHVPAHRNDMPVARLDSMVEGTILVVEPRCHNPLGPTAALPRMVTSEVQRSKRLQDAIRDALDKWLMRPPVDTSKSPPGG